MDTEVLVVGAGPTGLALALWLKRFGVAVRIVDRDDGPGETSRALVVHARILEFYRQFGIADAVIAAGDKVEELDILKSGRRIARLPFGDFGKGLSPYPFVLALPQDVHERVLIEQLAAEGLRVERQTEVTGFTEKGDGVTATLKTAGGSTAIESAYICGCDGAHSIVRHTLGIGFPGGTYSQVFYVADVVASGIAAEGGLTVCLDRGGFSIVLPIRRAGAVRLIGIVPREVANPEAISFDDVRASAAEKTGLRIDAVNWFSTYRVHHRVADSFRRGRAFLLGDAAHIHSPAGGQGMNTGISDAINLAWKLAATIQQRAEAKILDSYEPERIAFARRLVATTDRLFQAATDPSSFGSFARNTVLPRLLPFALRFEAARHLMFRTISQIDINYRASPLSSGIAGKIHGGDRLPWVDAAGAGNYLPLRSLDWQVHVYGEAQEPLRKALAGLGIALHVFAWSPAAAGAGLARDALYLVRPDGYIAMADPTQDPLPLQRYVKEWAVVPRLTAGEVAAL